MNWKKSIIFCVSFFAVFFGEVAVNIACGPEQDPYDYYVSYFHNNVQGDEYKSFAFNEMVYLYDSEELDDEYELNGKEWADYLKINKNDIIKVMYETDSSTDVRLKKFNGKNMNALPDSLKKNTFLIALTKKPSVYKYYKFSKSVEPLVDGGLNDWTPVERDSSIMIQKACDALDSINIVKNNSFLKLRYAYQAARLFHYAGDFEQCISTYKDFIKPSSEKSSVKGWATSLYAGALRNTGNGAEAAYFFSKVFAENRERRVQSYRNYFHIDTTIQAVLRYAQNNTEQANIYAINGFHDPKPSLAYLEKVYTLDPKSELNAALLVREVNKLEQNLIVGNKMANDYFLSFASRYGYREEINEDSLRLANLSHLKKVRAFALKLSNEHKYPQFELGKITAAYLSWIEGNDQLANEYLNKVNLKLLNPRLLDQYRIIELLLKAKQIQKAGAFVPDDLVPALKWLDAKRYAEAKADEQDDEYYYSWVSAEARFRKTTRNFYQQILAPAYQKMGDTTMAALAMLKGDLHFKNIKNKAFTANTSYQTQTYWRQNLSTKTMTELFNLRNMPSKSTLTSFLATSLKKLNADDFNELYGTTYLRTHQYDKALAIFNKLSPHYKMEALTDWQDYETKVYHYANPFITTINDYPKKYTLKNQNANKKTFAIKMLRLQRLIKSDPKNANSYYFQLANAVYQTGHFGNSWDYISYSWSADAMLDNNVKTYDDDYRLAKTAKKWYLKARSLSTNKDFKAKCTFMIAKCEQKKINDDHRVAWYGPNYKVQRKAFIIANINNPYFKEMRDNYGNTAFYKTAVEECSYLRDFLTRNP